MGRDGHEDVETTTAVEVYPSGVYDDDGVDVTQIHAMLALTPAERLDYLRAFARGLLELIDAAHAA